MSNVKLVYIIRIKKNTGPFSIFSKYQYQITQEPPYTAVQDIGEWLSLYKLYNTEGEAKLGVLFLWAIQNNPLLVLLYGMFFNKEVIQYRSDYANERGKSFWNI